MESQPPDADPSLERTRRLAKRYVSAIFVTLAGVFVFLSAQQIITGVYGVGIQPLAPALSIGTASCATELRGLEIAVDRAMIAAARATDEADATAAYRAALAPEWDADQGILARCAVDARGADAFAAVTRFRRAGESSVRHQALELAPLRHDIAAYLLP
jgi:hypothetical protein